MLTENYNYFLEKIYKTGNGSKVKVQFANNKDDQYSLFVDVVYASNQDPEDAIDHFLVTPLNEVDVNIKEELDIYFEEYFAGMEY